MTRLNNHSGFGVVEALLMLVVIGILGFTGWFVYHSRHAANKGYDYQSATSAGPKAQSSDTAQDTKVTQENELKPDGEERCFDGLCLTSTKSFSGYGPLNSSDYSLGFWLSHDLEGSDRVEFGWDDHQSGCTEWGGCLSYIVATEKLKDYTGVSLVGYIRTDDATYTYVQEVLKTSVVTELALAPKKEGTFYFDKYHFSKGAKSYSLTYSKYNFESIEQAKEFSGSATAKDAASIQKSLRLEK